MDEPLVVARGAERFYGTGANEVRALRSATCSILPGDRIALVGPSGSGKSTLLHLLGGLDLPTSGEVGWPGLGTRSELRPGKVVDIFQGPSLLPPLTVIENVRLPMLLAAVSDEEASMRALAALTAFQVGELREKLPEEISGGQAQRVAMALAVALRPALILADEPTGQLDSKTANEVLDTLLGLTAALNTAIVISTHQPSVAERCDVSWTMRDGELTIRGGVSDLATSNSARSSRRKV